MPIETLTSNWKYFEVKITDQLNYLQRHIPVQSKNIEKKVRYTKCELIRCFHFISCSNISAFTIHLYTDCNLNFCKYSYITI